MNGGVIVLCTIPYLPTTPLVTGPKNPTAGVILFACWYLMRARRVAGPNVVVSLFGEPGPVEDTGNPFWFRKICSCLTSLPVEPCWRFLVND